jgi:hypothetical protein
MSIWICVLKDINEKVCTASTRLCICLHRDSNMRGVVVEVEVTDNGKSNIEGSYHYTSNQIVICSFQIEKFCYEGDEKVTTLPKSNDKS